MADLTMDTYIPKDVSLPPAPDRSFWSDEQWNVVYAIADAIVPSIRTSPQSVRAKVISSAEYDVAHSQLATIFGGEDSKKRATQYLEEETSTNPAFRAILERLIGTAVHEEGKNGLGLILNALKYDSSERGRVHHKNQESIANNSTVHELDH